MLCTLNGILSFSSCFILHKIKEISWKCGFYLLQRDADVPEEESGVTGIKGKFDRLVDVKIKAGFMLLKQANIVQGRRVLSNCMVALTNYLKQKIMSLVVRSCHDKPHQGLLLSMEVIEDICTWYIPIGTSFIYCIILMNFWMYEISACFLIVCAIEGSLKLRILLTATYC